MATADGGFETGDMNTRMAGKGMDGADAFLQRRQPAGILQRIGRSDQPPDPVEAEPLHRQQAGGKVCLVRRVEGAAEQPDAHAFSKWRQDEAAPRRAFSLPP